MKKSRPLSPHLTVYRVQQGSFLSIFTRITGLFLLCSFFFVRVLFQGYEDYLTSYSYFHIFYGLFSLTTESPFIAIFIVLTFSVLFTYHLLLGLRHIYWYVNHNSPMHDLDIRNSRKVYIKYTIWTVFLSLGPVVGLFILYFFYDTFDIWPEEDE